MRLTDIVLIDVYPVAESTLQLLYGWLSDRTPEQSISHKEMPDWESHCAFVRRKPYHAWYLIAHVVTGEMLGSIYLSRHREVGIHVQVSVRGNDFGSQALNALRTAHPGKMFANINPANEASIRFFQRHGARLIQHTYELPA